MRVRHFGIAGFSCIIALASNPIAAAGVEDLFNGNAINSLAAQLRKAAEDATKRPPATVPVKPAKEVRDESVPPVSLSKIIQGQTDTQRSVVAASMEDDIGKLQLELDKRLNEPEKTPDILNEIDALNKALTAKRQARDFTLGNQTQLSNAAAESYAALNNPYFLICRDVIWAPKDPLQWSARIQAKQPEILKAGRSVGMISLNGALVGTAFVVGDNQVITNLHVLKDIANFDAASKRWIFKQNVRLQFDVEYPLGAEVGCPSAQQTRTYFVNGVWALPKNKDDMAILLTSKDEFYPPRLTVKTRPPATYSGNMVVAILGYPGLPADMTVTEQMEYFRTVDRVVPQYPFKRVSAGYTGSELVTADGVFTHRANTAGGNSGSPVLDLNDGSVVGIHMQGYNRFNDVMGYNQAITSERVIQLLKLAGLDK